MRHVTADLTNFQILLSQRRKPLLKHLAYPLLRIDWVQTKVGFGYDSSVSLQTDDVGHVGAAVLAQVACVVGLQTNDIHRN